MPGVPEVKFEDKVLKLLEAAPVAPGELHRQLAWEFGVTQEIVRRRCLGLIREGSIELNSMLLYQVPRHRRGVVAAPATA